MSSYESSHMILQPLDSFSSVLIYMANGRMADNQNMYRMRVYVARQRNDWWTMAIYAIYGCAVSESEWTKSLIRILSDPTFSAQLNDKNAKVSNKLSNFCFFRTEIWLFSFLSFRYWIQKTRVWAHEVSKRILFIL